MKDIAASMVWNHTQNALRVKGVGMIDFFWSWI